MPIPTLLKKTAGSIKRDRKDVRAVMTVNESEVPANSIVSFQQNALETANSAIPLSTADELKQQHQYYFNRASRNAIALREGSGFQQTLVEDLMQNDEMPLLPLLSLSATDARKLYKSLPEESVNAINQIITSNNLRIKDIPKTTQDFVNQNRTTVNNRTKFIALSAQAQAIKRALPQDDGGKTPDYYMRKEQALNVTIPEVKAALKVEKEFRNKAGLVYGGFKLSPIEKTLAKRELLEVQSRYELASAEASLTIMRMALQSVYS